MADVEGWAGLGISKNGDMVGSDIALGWIDAESQKVHLTDRMASGYFAPGIVSFVLPHLLIARPDLVPARTRCKISTTCAAAGLLIRRQVRCFALLQSVPKADSALSRCRSR